MASNDIHVYDVEAYITLSLQGGDVSLPITRFSSQFALNSVPQANCSVTLGIDIKYDELSPIHAALKNQLQYRLKAKVYSKVKNTYSENNADLNVTSDKIFDGNWFVLFEGYMSGSGYRRSGSSIEYVISLEHWLSDLAIASGMSEDLQPTTADNFTFPATFYDPQLNRNGVLLPKTANLSLLAATISNDVWFGIKKFFLDICDASPVGVKNAFSGNAAARAFRSNGPAKEALGRFLEQAPYPGLVLGGVSGIVSKKIADTIIAKGESTYVGNSIWDNLIIFSTALLFNVVPLIEKALVAAKTPNLKTVYTTISAGEIFSFDISTGMPKFISGVVLKNHMAADGSFYTANLAQPGLPKQDLVVGSYFTDKAEGTVVFQMSPEWLITPLVDIIPPQLPPFIQARGVGGAPPVNVADAANASRSLSDKFAKTMYGNEVLKYRNGQLSGRLRLDISPGSIIKIQASTNDILPANELNNNIVAHVDSVAIYLDAVAGQASTAFGLSSIRYEDENDSGNLTVDNNPLYAASFSGAPIHLGNL